MKVAALGVSQAEGPIDKEIKMKRIAGFCVMVTLIGVSTCSAAALAKIATFRGQVSVTASGTDQAKAVTMKNYPLNAGDKITTGKKGIARVVYPDGSYFDVRKSSDLVI